MLGGVYVESFAIEIAGLVVHVQPLFESTREFCKSYLTDIEPDFFVRITHEDLTFEQMLLEREAVAEGIRIRKYQGPFLERAVILRQVADQLVSRDTLMLHGSTVAVDGQAYLFTAPCGTGKSTHTRLWRQVFGDRAVMVNDDKPFLKIMPDGVFACGSPWSGKHGLSANVCVPLKGICYLQRGRQNLIHRVGPECVTAMLHHQAHSPSEESLLEKSHALVDILATRVPLWEMHCNMDPDAARVSYAAMSETSE